MIRNQRGLSLLWVAILMAGLAALAMLTLFSMKSGRNLAAESWSKWTQGSGAEALKKTQQAVDNVKNTVPGAATGRPPKEETGGLRKCVVNGKVLYSDVECRNNATSRKVEIHDSQGVEAPKKPPEPKEDTSAPTLQQKAMERAIEKATR